MKGEHEGMEKESNGAEWVMRMGGKAMRRESVLIAHAIKLMTEKI